MANWIYVGIGAGLAAAALHSSVLVPSPLSIVLFYLAPLPLFLAGLGWGTISALIGGAAGAVAIVLGVGPRPALFFVGGTALAPLVLSHLALISRPKAGAAANEGEAADQDLEWYPEGRLVLWSTGMAGALMSAIVLAVGPDAESFRATLREMAEKVFDIVAQGRPPEQAEQLRPLVDLLVFAAPLVSASLWLVAMLVNLWAASRLLKASGRSLRPWAKFGALTFPPSASLLLALAVAAALLPGTLGLIGSIFAAVMTTAFAILGLAVLHGLIGRSPLRALLLVALYVSLFLLNWLMLVPLVLVALADLLFRLRNRAATPD